MAKTETTQVLHSRNGSRAYFVKEHIGGDTPDANGIYLRLYLNWSLGEFDELAEFVKEQKENLKQAELAPEDEVPGGDK